MKKSLAVLAFLMAFALIMTGCGKEASTPDVLNDDKAAESLADDIQEGLEDLQDAAKEYGDGNVGKEWPEEFDKWDVPIIKNAEISFADNRSATQEGMTQGVVATVNLKSLSRDDFDSYLKKLEKSGFTKNSESSFGDIMIVYEKSIDGGELTATLSYTDDTTTIIVKNSAAEGEKNDAAGGKVEWPDSLKDIPEFKKGKFKETVEMGGGMYSITFLDVTEDDLDWYRDEIKDAGFVSQESEDTEGYSKLGSGMAYSVGFTLTGSTLQIIAMSQSY